MSENKKSSGESFAGNVMKYSVATYLGFAITGLALIVKGLLPAEVLGAPVTFMTYTATIMNIGILGLDQALLRFYHEPPAGAEPRQLFAACTRISAAFMMLLGVAGSVFFAQPLAAAFGLGSAGPGIVPLLFLNAALYMLVRYLNVLLRLENDLRAYTAETLWMQGCYNLFYLLPGFFTSNVFILAVAAILSFGVVAIAFGYKYRSAVVVPLPAIQLGGNARPTVPYGVALAAMAATVAAMFTAGENRVEKIVAVGWDKRVMAPCGRCREFLMQLGNPDAQVLVAEDTVVKVKDLLPYYWTGDNQ